MARVQIEELIYADSFDNAAGPQFDQPLLIIDTNPAVWTGTMGDGSVTPLSKYFAAQAQRAFSAITYTQGLAIFKALVSIQTVSNVASPAVGVNAVAGVVTFYATIPAGYVGSFVWGMTPDSTGGFAFPGGAGAGGGSGTASAVTVVSQQMIAETFTSLDGEKLIGSWTAVFANPAAAIGSVHIVSSFTLTCDAGGGATSVTCRLKQQGGSDGCVVQVSMQPGDVLPVSLCMIDAGIANGAVYEVTAEALSGGATVTSNDGGSPQLGVITGTVINVA